MRAKSFGVCLDRVRVHFVSENTEESCVSSLVPDLGLACVIGQTDSQSGNSVNRVSSTLRF